MITRLLFERLYLLAALLVLVSGIVPLSPRPGEPIFEVLIVRTDDPHGHDVEIRKDAGSQDMHHEEVASRREDAAGYPAVKHVGQQECTDDKDSREDIYGECSDDRLDDQIGSAKGCEATQCDAEDDDRPGEYAAVTESQQREEYGGWSP